MDFARFTAVVRPLAKSTVIATILLIGHATLIGSSLSRNAVTIDEFAHLPAGVSYWHHGTFWCYHHNPPLVKLAFSLPAVVMRVPTDYRRWTYVPGSRKAEWHLGEDFLTANKHHYMRVYAICRAVVVGLSVLGGYLVFRWSRELFGSAGGLVSLVLWVFCPEILAHGGLATIDMGATVAGLGASYGFRNYLKRPSWQTAAISGTLLGLAQATKFSMVVLLPVWLVLFCVATLIPRARDNVCRVPWRHRLVHAAIVCAVSLYVLNSLYLFEGTGRALGSFDFRSRLFTGESKHSPEGQLPIANRFRHGASRACPCCCRSSTC